MDKIKFRMKNIFALFLLVLMLASCQTRVVSTNKPLKDNSLELYHTYTVQQNNAKPVKVKVLKLDDEKVYGKLKSGEDIVINKSDILDVKKPDVFSSVLIGLGAVAAVIFIPM